MLIFSLVNYCDDWGTTRTAERLLNIFPDAKVYVTSNSPSNLVSNLRLIHTQSESNRGYGAGHNSNLRAALADGTNFDAVFFANSDIHIEISDPTRATSSIRALRDTPAFLCTNQASNRPNAGYFFPFFSLYRSYPCSVMYPAGNFFGLTRPLVVPSLFDEQFFLYFEEVDLRLRNRKVPIVLIPDIKIDHPNSRILDRHNKPALDFAPASRLRLARKHFGPLGVMVARCQNLAVRVLKSL